jgi:hypothetical protein
MPNNVRAEDDETSSARPSWREARPGSVSHVQAHVQTMERGRIEPASVSEGYTSEELSTHANEQLRASPAANESARVRQPLKPLRANAARVQFQRATRGNATTIRRSDPASPEVVEPSAT